MSNIRVATVAGDAELEPRFSAAITLRDDVELVLRCVDRVELLAAIRGGLLDALIVIGDPPWFDRQSASEAIGKGIRVVAMTDGSAPLGASSVLGTSASLDDLIRACASDDPLPETPAAAPPSTGRTVAVWGPKGAPGRTRLAIELAFELQATGAETILVDADPYGGDILQLLGMVEEIPSIVWAARAAAKGELNRTAVEAELRRARSGPVVLPGLPRADLWPDVTEFGFAELLDRLAGCCAYVVCDTGFCLEHLPTAYAGDTDARNRMTRAALLRSDRILAVCRGDVVGIRNFLWSFQELTSLVSSDKVSIVLNRARPGAERETADFLYKHLGKRPVAYIPDRPDKVEAAVASGSALREADASPDVLAAVQAAAISVGARLEPKGFLSKLGRKK